MKVPSDDKSLWEEIDDAVVSGFIREMNEVCCVITPYDTVKETKFGTKIWFNSKVSPEKCQKIAEYIRETYNMQVEHTIPLCIVVWHHKIWRANHA